MFVAAAAQPAAPRAELAAEAAALLAALRVFVAMTPASFLNAPGVKSLLAGPPVEPPRCCWLARAEVGGWLPGDDALLGEPRDLPAPAAAPGRVSLGGGACPRGVVVGLPRGANPFRRRMQQQ